MKKLLPLLVTALFLILACSKDSPVETEDLRGTISGVITATNGDVISGVSIGTNGSHDAVSNYNGVYNIPDITPGLYEIIYSKAGFIDTTLDTSIVIAKLNDVVDINVVLTLSTGSIYGKIVDEDNLPLVGVSITATNGVKTFVANATLSDKSG